MLKYPQLATSYVLYGLGHLIYLVLDRFMKDGTDDERPHIVCRLLGRPYQWCMVTSSHLDEWDVLWKRVSREHQ